MNYLLEFTVCITIFYGLYYLIFRRLTFVRLNRIYLLSSLVVGLSLPLISYQIKEIVKIPARVEYEETSSIPLMMNSSTPLLSNTSLEEPFDWNVVLQGIYILGILFMLIKLIHSFRLIAKEIILKSSNHINHSPDNRGYIPTQSNYANSSFFNLIFIDDSNLSENEINQILEHEKWHIRLFHSYDLLFVEILKIIFWFNPILWLYQRSFSEVHEYEVDTRMIQAYNPQTYVQLLLKLATTSSQLATSHQFSRKPLTDRIHFLFTKQKSVPMKRLAYLSVLPILGAFFMAFSVEKVVDYQEVEEGSKYFKIVRNRPETELSEIEVSTNKVLSKLYLNKDRIALNLNPNKVSEETIVEASKYFKEYGYSLTILEKEFDAKKKLSKIEIGLTEDNVSEKKKTRKNKVLSEFPRTEKFSFNLTKMRTNGKGMDAIIMIMADRQTGEHFVSPLGPPSPPPPPLAPKAPPAPTKPPLLPVKVGMLKKNESDKVGEVMINNEPIKLIGEGELGQNPLVLINGKSYPSDVLYKLNPTKISNTATYRSEAVFKKFGIENRDGGIEINTFNRSNEDLFLSEKQLKIAVENAMKKREARTSGKKLTRVTLKDFNGNETDEVAVYKNGNFRASVTVSKGGQVFFQVGDVVKTEDEMKNIDSQLLGSNCSASDDKKEIAKLGIKINNKTIEGVMKFNQ